MPDGDIQALQLMRATEPIAARQAGQTARQ
jgi:hypothetical protein